MSKILITLRRHRLDPHALDVAPPAGDAGTDIAPSRRRSRRAQAGAAILHLHARDPATGRPSADPEHFMAFLPAIRAGCDAVINLTTGG